MKCCSKNIICLFFALLSVSAAAFAQTDISRNEAAPEQHSWSIQVFPQFVPVSSFSSPSRDERGLGDAHQLFADAVRTYLPEVKVKSLRPIQVRDQRRDDTSGMLYVFYYQTWQGLRVEGSDVKAIFADGKLASIGSRYYPNLKLSTHATLKAAAAGEIAMRAVDVNGSNDDKIISSQLVVYPLSSSGSLAKLAWKMEVMADRDGEEVPYTVFVDARRGRVLEQYENVEHATVEGDVSAIVIPDITLQWTPTPGVIEAPLANLKVVVVNPANPLQIYSEAVTDASGHYAISYDDALFPNVQLRMAFDPIIPSTNIVPTPIASPTPIIGLMSPYVRVKFDTSVRSVDGRPRIPNDSIVHTYTPQSLNDVHSYLFNVDAPPWYRDRNQEASAFYFVNKVHDFFVSGTAPFHLPELDTRAFVNAKLGYYFGPCVHSVSSGAATNVLMSIPPGDPTGCPNYALVSDNFYHEYGHVVIAKSLYYSGANWAEVDATNFVTHGNAMDEGFGDYVAGVINNADRIGYSSMPYRHLNIPKIFPTHFLVSGTSANAINSQIVSGAFWSLRHEMVSVYGAETGTARANNYFLRAFMGQPHNFGEIFQQLAAVAATSEFGGTGDIFAAPDRTSICRAFGLQHGLNSGSFPTPVPTGSPNGVPVEYCGEVRTHRPDMEYAFNLDTFFPGDPVRVSGSGFGALEPLTLALMPHEENREEGSAIGTPLASVVITAGPDGRFGNAALMTPTPSNMTPTPVTTPVGLAIWGNSQAGTYDILVDAMSDGTWQAQRDVVRVFSVVTPAAIAVDSNGDTVSQFDTGAPVYVRVTGVRPNTSVNVAVITGTDALEDGAVIEALSTIAVSPLDAQPLVTELWTAASAGSYDIVIDVNQNGTFESATDYINSQNPGENAFIVASPSFCGDAVCDGVNGMGENCNVCPEDCGCSTEPGPLGQVYLCSNTLSENAMRYRCIGFMRTPTPSPTPRQPEIR